MQKILKFLKINEILFIFMNKNRNEKLNTHK